MLVKAGSIFSGYATKEVSGRILKTGLILLVTTLVVSKILVLLGLQDTWSLTVRGVKSSVSIWTLVMIAIFWVDGTLYIRNHHKGSSDFSYTAVGIVLAVLVMVSVILHEIGHALAASIFAEGITEAGISWWGAFVLPATSFFDSSPKAQIAIALAGPVTNLALAAIAALYVALKDESLSENAVQYFAVINIRLAKYNLLPIVIILDGGKAVHGVVRLLGVSADNSLFVSWIAGLLVLFIYLKLTRGKESLERKLARI